MFFSPPTSGWEDLPLLEDVPTWDNAPSLRRNLVPPRTPATPQRNCCFHPYHPDARLPANILLTPPSPSFISPSHRFSSRIQNSITQALENGWAKSTLAGYSQHVTHFLAFCKQEEVPAALQFPADEFVLCAYAASDTGRVSASTIQNRLSGLKAWHNAHGATWNGGLCLQVVINGAKNLAPSSSKKPPHPPITIAMLQCLFDGLDLTKPLDAAVAACALLAFWGQCRLGELLSTSALDLSTTSKPARSHFNHSTRSIGSHTLALPWTKTNQNGEKVVLVPRSDSLDPISHVRSHLATSTLPSNLPLLAYSTPSGPRMLTKATFLARCNQVWMASGYPRTTGHSFRIGGTTELLTSGVPPDVVKSMGRWSSDLFLHYWRDLETIAPLHARNVYRKKPGRSSGGI